MASINKIELKDLQITERDDNSCVYAGFVAYKGEVLGRWMCDTGADRQSYEFDKDILRKEAGIIEKAINKEAGEPQYFSINQLLLRLAKLTKTENEVKNAKKLGYMSVIYIDDGYNDEWICSKIAARDVKLSEYYKKTLLPYIRNNFSEDVEVSISSTEDIFDIEYKEED